MGAVDWTEKCRDEMPISRRMGYLDFPFESGETMDDVVIWDQEKPEDEDDEC